MISCVQGAQRNIRRQHNAAAPAPRGLGMHTAGWAACGAWQATAGGEKACCVLPSFPSSRCALYTHLVKALSFGVHHRQHVGQVVVGLDPGEVGRLDGHGRRLDLPPPQVVCGRPSAARRARSARGAWGLHPTALGSAARLGSPQAERSMQVSSSSRTGCLRSMCAPSPSPDHACAPAHNALPGSTRLPRACSSVCSRVYTIT